MKRFDSEDEPVRFYLEHRLQIEEWARIGMKDLRGFVSIFYSSLHEDMERVSLERGIDINNDVDVVTGELFVRLRRRDWPETISIELGWVGNADFSDRESWHGLKVEGGAESPYWDVLIQARDRLGAASYGRRDRAYGYPMYEYLRNPEPDVWKGNNLERYGNFLLEALLQAWQDLTPLVDESLSQSCQ